MQKPEKSLYQALTPPLEKSMLDCGVGEVG